MVAQKRNTPGDIRPHRPQVRQVLVEQDRFGLTHTEPVVAPGCAQPVRARAQTRLVEHAKHRHQIGCPDLDHRAEFLGEQGSERAFQAGVGGGRQVDLDPGALALLDDSDERHLYRVTQEALRNVVSHAQATAVEISVRRGVADGAVVLDIADDGVGFDAAAVLDSPPQGHLGLRVLRDQAAEAHGRLEVTTAPGCGTRWSLALFNRTEKPV
jgi:signal transduction histidine kinase